METESNRTLLRLTFFILIGLISILVFLVFVSSIPGPISINSKVKSTIQYVLPQGWAFFTRDAREEKILIFKRADNGKLERFSTPLSSPEYFFGLSRLGRRIPVEYSRLSNKIDSSLWVPFRGDFEALVSAANHLEIKNITNKLDHPKIQGEIIVVRAKTKPWAWAASDNVYMPSKIIRLYVNSSI